MTFYLLWLYYRGIFAGISRSLMEVFRKNKNKYYPNKADMNNAINITKQISLIHNTYQKKQTSPKANHRHRFLLTPGSSLRYCCRGSRPDVVLPAALRCQNEEGHKNLAAATQGTNVSN